MTEATSKPGDISFDSETHTYNIGGRQLPSVTQVINAIMPGWQADEWYMQRGTAMHHGCRLLDENRLDWSSVSPEIDGRVKAWQKFRKDFRADVVSSEFAMHHSIYGFAGTLDRVLIDEVVNPPHLILADLKSSICAQVKVQLGAYKLLWDSGGHTPHRIKRAVAVELSDDGTYRTLWMNEKDLELAQRTFLACLTIHNFMRAENIRPQIRRAP